MSIRTETPADAGSSGGAAYPTSPATPARRSRADRPDGPGPSGQRPTRARPVEARSRGTLTLSEQVIGKIAAQSASEVALAGGRSGGVLGIGSHSDLSAKPKVDVELRETSADLSIAVSLPWGVSIRETTRQVREQVSRRVEQLAGVTVHRVDIDVAVLVLSDPNQTEGELR